VPVRTSVNKTVLLWLLLRGGGDGVGRDGLVLKRGGVHRRVAGGERVRGGRVIESRGGAQRVSALTEVLGGSEPESTVF
jgi:hypothetical protein